MGGGFVGMYRGGGGGRKEEVKHEPWQDEGMGEAARMSRTWNPCRKRCGG